MALNWDKLPNKATFYKNRFQHMEASRRMLSRSENTLEEYKQKLKDARKRKDFQNVLRYENLVKYWSDKVYTHKRNIENDISEYDKGYYGR